MSGSQSGILPRFSHRREPVLNHTDPVRAVNPRHWLRCMADASPFAVMAGREALCCDHLNLAYSQVWTCICKWKSCINWTNSEFDRRYFLLIISDIFDIFDIFENIKISNKSYNNVICYMLMHYLMNVSYQLFVPLKLVLRYCTNILLGNTTRT